MTGIAIMHEDTLAQWLVTIGKKIRKLNVCFVKFELMLGFYENKNTRTPVTLPYFPGLSS